MDTNLKVGILYVAIGKYTVFLEKFYESCENNLFPGVEKTYYVFTDSKRIALSEYVPNIKVINVKNYGWPGNTLFRYHMFLNNINVFKDNDFLLFLNANTEIVDKINIEEFLPEDGKKLVVAKHPYYYKEHSLGELPFERDSKSVACVSDTDKEYTYVGGGFVGGYKESFIDLCKTLCNNIDTDLKNNVIAKWHDESHFNKYVNDNINDVFVKDVEYFYPLELREKLKDIKPKIIIIPKEMLGGHDFLRDMNDKMSGFNVLLNNNLVKEMYRVRDRLGKYHWLKRYKDDISDTSNFGNGRIVDEKNNIIKVLWNYSGLQTIDLGKKEFVYEYK